ncbi:M12 family metallo-peptidase [Dokdonella sp.]|uniref:M12 family metallo-peptidase n=1 Tax=Dokdonella sp. TaxID=2291710 RepID=UPI002BFB4C93|nr:M12 family metallo-peptidase [Dokdonella sp.]HOX70593.1 M12 family metallo-peptidase [Dokdonella sp.]HPN78040.1 M12 family metallo-peptidase [Dokdonella sp.]
MLRPVIFLLSLFALPNALAIAPGQASVSDSVLNTLARAPVGAQLDVKDFPAGPGLLAPISFRRIEVYAPDARIVVVDAAGEHEIPRSPRVHLLGYSKDGVTRVALSFDPDLVEPPYGAGSGSSGAFELRSERSGNAWQFTAISAEAALPPGIKLDYPANDDSPANPSAPFHSLDHLIPAEMAGGPLRFATVGVDTDVSFMTERFSGNTTQATAWIADLFAQMNVMYERDLDVRLLQGTTFLRPASDPYPNTNTPASEAMLIEFGNYWQANYSGGAGAVSRAFAMLLSGNASTGNSASGIAWVNSYCQISGSGGSYSTNQVFTNSAIAVSFSATLVGHEVGHNFGAAHTHCSNATTGSYPTATNTIDQCSNAGSGCYAGTRSCPTSGPGAPRGSIMSYCNQLTDVNGNAVCGQNVLQFHPTHVTQVRARVAANTPSCLFTSDVIFANGFQ